MQAARIKVKADLGSPLLINIVYIYYTLKVVYLVFAYNITQKIF